jgi:hypothetical protein
MNQWGPQKGGLGGTDPPPQRFKCLEGVPLKQFSQAKNNLFLWWSPLQNRQSLSKKFLRTSLGLKWPKFSYLHESWSKKKCPNSGYLTVFNNGCSPHIAIFNGEALIVIERSNEIFTFVSVTACAAWNDDLKLTITAHRDAAQINTHTTTLLFGQPRLILLQWKNIDKITFKSFGGTSHPGNGVASPYAVVTQLTMIYWTQVKINQNTCCFFEQTFFNVLQANSSLTAKISLQSSYSWIKTLVFAFLVW